MNQREDDVFEIGDEDIVAPKTSSSPWKYILLGCGFFALMCAAAVGVVIYRAINLASEFINDAQARAVALAEAGEGAARFRLANGQINSSDGEVGFGNSEEAIKLARAFSEQIREMREDLFTKREKPAKFSLTGGKFLVYCHLDGDRCVFLVHVPDLRKFDSDAKKFLGMLGWSTVQSVVTKSELPTKPTSLALGMRGIMLYDRVITGTLAKSEDDSETIDFEFEDDSDKLMLYSFFAAEVEEMTVLTDEAQPESLNEKPTAKPVTPDSAEAPAKDAAPQDAVTTEKEKTE